MSRERYAKIMKHLRFDDFQRRRQRRESDKFCLISEVWNSFIENCKKYYVPNFDLTIDEQLFPCKTRCPFIQYMANKPDKFGIKFWLLADAQTKYLCNRKPYLGKDPARSRCTDLLGDVCLNLLQPYFGKGYNVTTDNYFTSLKLAEELMTKKTTILGTIRKQRREVPNTESLIKDKLLHDSQIFSSPSDCSLTVYKAKKKKIVCILSSTHKHVKVDEGHKKKLPETVQYYNKSKVGVDVLDQMARYHTCKSSSRQWPVAVFFNILDSACINSFIIYSLVTKTKLTRRQFLLELIKELCKSKDGIDSSALRRVSTETPSTSNPLEVQRSRKRRECQFTPCGNKSVSSCQNCGKVCCGKHTFEKVTIVTCKNCKN